MKKLLLPIFIFLTCLPIIAEDDFDMYMRQGMELHDIKEYCQAIEMYEKALDILPYSSKVHYEIALSYFESGEYRKAIEYLDFVLKMDEELVMPAFLLKTSCVSSLGRNIEAIEMVEKKMEEIGPDPLLHYQMGFLYHNLNNRVKATESFISSILLKVDHPASHFMLGVLMSEGEYHLQSILCIFYSLFVNPYTDKGKEIHDLLKIEMKKAGIAKVGAGSYIVGRAITSRGSTSYIISTMFDDVKKHMESENVKFMDYFVQDTKTLVEKLKNNDGTIHPNSLWGKFYVPFFLKLEKSGHLETFCYIICQSIRPEAGLWLDENTSKIDAFYQWINE